MSDFPIVVAPPLNVITPFHRESLGGVLRSLNATPLLINTASSTFIQDQAYYYPFRIWQTSLAVKMSYIVGGTANGNIDLGIYDNQSHRLVSSGLTGQGTINVLQELDITDTLLVPGIYYMAIKSTSATGTAFRKAINDELSMSSIPFLKETLGAGVALPATATMAMETDTVPSFYAMGVHFSTLI